MAVSWARAVPGGVTVAVAAQPNAKKSEIVGVYGDSLKIKVASPPVEGAANAALLAFLGAQLGVRQRDLSLLRGATSRQKVVEIKGVTLDEVETRLTPPSG